MQKIHENAEVSKELDLNSSHVLVCCCLLSTDMMQLIFDCHEGVAAEINLNIRSRNFAVSNHGTLTVG